MHSDPTEQGIDLICYRFAQFYVKKCGVVKYKTPTMKLSIDSDRIKFVDSALMHLL